MIFPLNAGPDAERSMFLFKLGRVVMSLLEGFFDMLVLNGFYPLGTPFFIWFICLFKLSAILLTFFSSSVKFFRINLKSESY